MSQIVKRMIKIVTGNLKGFLMAGLFQTSGIAKGPKARTAKIMAHGLRYHFTSFIIPPCHRLFTRASFGFKHLIR